MRRSICSPLVSNDAFNPFSANFTKWSNTLTTNCLSVFDHFYPYVMPFAIRYNLYNLKKVKKTHGGVLLLVKLQVKA